MLPRKDICFSLGIPLKSGQQPDNRLPLALAAITASFLSNFMYEQWKTTKLFNEEEKTASMLNNPPTRQVMEAINEAVNDLAGRICAVKWPNDVLLAHKGDPDELQYRKCGGILVERTANALVIGIGLNVNSRCSDFDGDFSSEITTLHECIGHEVERESLFSGLAMRTVWSSGIQWNPQGFQQGESLFHRRPVI